MPKSRLQLPGDLGIALRPQADPYRDGRVRVEALAGLLELLVGEGRVETAKSCKLIGVRLSVGIHCLSVHLDELVDT